MENRVSAFEKSLSQLGEDLKAEIFRLLSKQDNHQIDFDRNRIKILYEDDNDEFYYGQLSSIFCQDDKLVIEISFDGFNDYIHIYEIDHPSYFQASNLLDYYRSIIANHK